MPALTHTAAIVVAAVLVAALAGCGAPAPAPAHSSSPAVDATASITSSQASGDAASGPGAGGAPRCTGAQVTARAATDRPTYRSGDVVNVSSTLTNHSGQACSLSVSAREPAFSVSGGQGEVWRSCGPGQTCPLYERQVVLQPGGSETQQTMWDQHSCSASACDGPAPGAGAYEATANWGALGSATAAFTLA